MKLEGDLLSLLTIISWAQRFARVGSDGFNQSLISFAKETCFTFFTQPTDALK
jgi:hypothetical protein